MLSFQTVFLVALTFFLMSERSNGLRNVTNTTTTPPTGFECLCTDCGEHRREPRCKARFGCFSSLKSDKDNGYILSKGCLENEVHYQASCTNKKYLIVCCQEDMCNRNITPKIPTEEPITITPSIVRDSNVEFMVLSIGAPVGALIVLLLVVYAVFHHLEARNQRNQKKVMEVEVLNSVSCNEIRGNGYRKLQELLETSAGSGSGLPVLQQRKFVQDIQLLEVIGEGRYGRVHRGIHHGEDVAVKIFNSKEDESWKRESEIYNTNMLRHENIVGFIASDIISRRQVTEMWLVMYYYENGSLYDFLSNKMLSTDIMCRLAHSAASGLAHLHSGIQGVHGKAAIAHCDIKSKNILVKTDMTCAIGDFGLVYHKDRDETKIPLNRRVGTKRYMAPEILDDSFKLPKTLDYFKRADIYAFGLVLWEIARRTFTAGIKAEEYQPPFYDMVPQDPSFEEMKKVVVTEMKRPTVPNRWIEDSALEVMAKVMKECWKQNASARLTSLRVMKSLSKLRDTICPPQQNCSFSEENTTNTDVNILVPDAYM